VCDKIQDGAHHSPKDAFPVREPGTFPYVTSKNIRNWFLDKVNVTYVGVEFHNTIYPRCNAEFGDVLLTKDGANTGQVTVNTFREPISLLSSVCLIKTNRSKLDPRFLVYYIQSNAGFENITGQMTGAAIKRIILKNIKSSGIPLPPLAEQQRIVAILDEAFEGLDRARAHADANLRNARELFESFLGAVFTSESLDWISVPLGELVEADCTLSYGIVQPGDETAGGLPIVRPTDLDKRIITLAGLKRINPERAEGYARTKLKGSEILLCVRGSTGVVSMVSDELEGANVTRGIVPVRFAAARIEQKLGYYQFLSRPVQDQIRSRTYGAALMQINIRDVRQLKFAVPPMDQQALLVERIESVAADFDSLVGSYTQKAVEINDLRQSLLQKAFAGELT
ncbi:MAG: restriction endonuclease subunit S, partial [Pseudomonadales bacterium]